jgi:methyltransferase (TIGR00027 family)
MPATAPECPTMTDTADREAIARTAYYCCGVRAADASSSKPLCGDHLAQHFMDEAAWRTYAPFSSMRSANASNAVRHRLIDDLLRERLQAAPALQVLLLGAGFDTRAFRLRGGRWFELDNPALLRIKEQVLAQATAPNPLQRVGIDFANERLAHKLAPLDGSAAVLVVMEGVSMYLDNTAFGETAQTLHRLLPRHTLVCDLIGRRCASRFGRAMRRRIKALGGDFAPLHEDPAAFVETLGYRRLACRSIPQAAAELGALPIPLWVLGSLLRSLRDGYQLCEFEPVAGA